MRESVIEKYLDERVEELGGFTRKIRYVGRRGCVDRLVILNGVHLVELKRPGTKKADDHQEREHEKIKKQGVPVYLLADKEDVDNFLRGVLIF